MNLEFETTNHFLYHQIEDEDGTEIARFGAGKPTRTIISGTHQIRYTSTRLLSGTHQIRYTTVVGDNINIMKTTFECNFYLYQAFKQHGYTKIWGGK